MVPLTYAPIAIAAALEGIPVSAIARIVKYSYSDVYDTLQDAKDAGQITSMPRSDWPPGTKAEAHVPPIPVAADSDFIFRCSLGFKLTGLEAAMLNALFKSREVTKERLHTVIEHQRASRQTALNDLEPTDIKMVDVMICKLRKKLTKTDERVIITTMWGTGYYIDKAVKEVIRARLYEETEGTIHAQETAQEPPQETPAGSSAAETPAGAPQVSDAG